MRKQFKAPWDLKLTAITTILGVVLIGILFYIPGLWPSLLILGILLGCAAFGVYGYSIQDGKLKIIRLGWATEIQLSAIQKIEQKPHAMMGSIRVFGIGGLFGYIGYFKNSILGKYKAYATHSDKTVLIITKNARIIVTPDDPLEFTESLKESMNLSRQ